MRHARTGIVIAVLILPCTDIASTTPVSPPETRTIVVIGATGQQGGAVARQLLERGHRVRAVTRSPAKAAARDLASLGADIVQADLREPTSLDRALAGAHDVFGVTDFWEHGREGEVQQGRNLVDAAKRAGIKHFVFSSVGSADRGTGIPHFDSKREIELYLKRSQLPFTILRPVAFMDNWNDAARELAGGEILDALRPTTRLQHIAVADIGRFAAEAFDHPQLWIGRELDIAGDELTMTEIAAAFSRVLGHRVSYRQIDWTDLRRRDGPEVEAMVRWFDAGGYDVDIDALRREFPWLQDFNDYLHGRTWAPK